MKILLFKLKNLHTSACLKLNYGTTQTKNVKATKMVKFIKICDQNPCRFTFGNFSTQLPYPPLPRLTPFHLAKNRSGDTV